MDTVQEKLLNEISGLTGIPSGAYSIRVDGQSLSMNSTSTVKINKKIDKNGIDIIISENAKEDNIHIPVVLTESGLNDVVYNDFYIGDNADVTIVAGCGIHNCGSQKSQHDGIHTFHIGKNARVKYIEKHYGEGNGKGARVLNPVTIVDIDEKGYMEMDTVQIKGVDSTERKTMVTLKEDAHIVVKEKIMTHENQFAKTSFVVELNGDGSSAHVVSRSVAKDNSTQEFLANIKGNSKCTGHSECDAIIMDNATVKAIPEILANNSDANLIHEAAIGKIAGEQLIKLMSLGLTEKEAEEWIVNGFLK